jgi:hypothetical protein
MRIKLTFGFLAATAVMSAAIAASSGSRLALLGGRQLFVISGDGAGATPVLFMEDVRGAAISPDGSKLAIARCETRGCQLLILGAKDRSTLGSIAIPSALEVRWSSADDVRVEVEHGKLADEYAFYKISPAGAPSMTDEGLRGNTCAKFEDEKPLCATINGITRGEDTVLYDFDLNSRFGKPFELTSRVGDRFEIPGFELTASVQRDPAGHLLVENEYMPGLFERDPLLADGHAKLTANDIEVGIDVKFESGGVVAIHGFVGPSTLDLPHALSVDSGGRVTLVWRIGQNCHAFVLRKSGDALSLLKEMTFTDPGPVITDWYESGYDSKSQRFWFTTDAGRFEVRPSDKLRNAELVVPREMATLSYQGQPIRLSFVN